MTGEITFNIHESWFYHGIFITACYDRELIRQLLIDTRYLEPKLIWKYAYMMLEELSIFAELKNLLITGIVKVNDYERAKEEVSDYNYIFENVELKAVKIE